MMGRLWVLQLLAVCCVHLASTADPAPDATTATVAPLSATKSRRTWIDSQPHSRALQARHQFIAGVRGRVSVTLSSALAWAGRLFRAGRIRIRPEGFACGTAGSSTMHSAVQPACVGSICYGPLAGAPGTNTVRWNGVKIAVPGVYELCWCEPQVSCAGPDAGFTGPGCCLTDSDYAINKGQINVLGPTWSGVNPLLGEPFDVDLTGSNVTLSSRILFRFHVSTGIGGHCGYALSAEERQASRAAIRYVRGWSSTVNQATFTARLFRLRRYTLCWCAGDAHTDSSLKTCATDAAFTAEVSTLQPHGPHTEGLSVLKAVVGAPFAITINGDALGYGDRLRVVDAWTGCGNSMSRNSYAVATSVCRSARNCMTSPIFLQPSSLSLGSHPLSETWDPVVVRMPGQYHMCWCVDNSWDPVRLESKGYCTLNSDFAVQVGTLLLEGIYENQVFNCDAFLPCTVFLSSHLTVSRNDGIFIASQQDLTLVSCGSGMQGVHLIAANTTEANVSQGRPNSTVTFNLFPHAGPPGTFRVCYCQSSAMGACADPINFAQVAGTIHIRPPVQSIKILHKEPPQYCLLGRACIVGITGVWASQLHPFDAFRAIPVRFTCGNVVPSVTSSIFSLASRTALLGGGMTASFLHASHWLHPPGAYKLCYCSFMLLGGGKYCQDVNDFILTTGDLFILGVKGVHQFSCSQGFACNASVPGWRFWHGDRLMLLAGTLTRCGVDADNNGKMAVGFPHNPAGNPTITNLSTGDVAEFAFGLAYGAGASRVCYCAFNTSANRCQKSTDFVQEVGLLRVTGVITSVFLSTSHPALASIVSLVITADVQDRVTCAVTEAPFQDIPTLWDVVHCHTRVPSCVGTARLPWKLNIGPNIIHVPLALNRSHLGALPQVHAWCVHDLARCPAGRCTMPPTAQGLTISLQPGYVQWNHYRVVRGDALTFIIRGNPLNSQGTLFIYDNNNGCGKGPMPFLVGMPTSSVLTESATWENVVFAIPGQYLLCWCDRGYGSVNDCAKWHRGGLVTVAGITGASRTLPWMNPGQAYAVNVSGVDLTSGGLLGVVPGDNCNNAASRLTHSAASPVQVTSAAAKWDLVAPAQPGNFTLCWGESSVFSTFIGFISVVPRTNCVLSSWSVGTCDKPCGNGSLTEIRSVLALPSGGGDACPSQTGLVRFKACNEQPCPTAFVSRARVLPATVQPGQIFRVILDGRHLEPAQDRIILLSGDDECSGTAQFHAGATCDMAGSNTTHLVCGDGVYALQVKAHGTYRICFCDASVSSALVNGTRLPCGSASSFSITPINGSQFSTFTPAVPSLVPEGRRRTGLFTKIADSKTTQSTGQRQQTQSSREAPENTLVIVLSIVGGAVTFIASICVWWCWIRKYKLKDGPKPTKVLDTSEIVKQATREVWNAYARSIVEGVEDDELRKASEEILKQNALAAEAAGWLQPQPEPEPSDFDTTTTTDSNSRLTTPDTLALSRGNTPPPLSRGNTPPALSRGNTPPTARGSTRSTRRTPPGTRGSTPATPTTGQRTCRTPPRTPPGRQSFFHESLSQGALPAAPKEGGSFLDMPLLGVSKPAPGPLNVATSQAAMPPPALDEESFKTTGSSWHSSAYRPSSDLTESQSSSSGSSRSSPRERLGATPPMAPRGNPKSLPPLQPLELPPRTSSEQVTTSGLQASQSHAGFPQEGLVLEAAPKPVSPPRNAGLSSSTGRPPGGELPQPPSNVLDAPAGPSEPPPDGLMDIMAFRADLRARLPELGPLPPLHSAAEDSRMEDGATIFPPRRADAPDMPPDPPPSLSMLNPPSAAPPPSASPPSATPFMPSLPECSSDPVQSRDEDDVSKPAMIGAQKEAALPDRAALADTSVVAPSKAKGWSLPSFFSGVRLPWSGSSTSTKKKSGRVSAEPPAFPSPQSDDEQLESMVKSSSSVAARLPTQKPESECRQVINESSLREHALAERLQDLSPPEITAPTETVGNHPSETAEVGPSERLPQERPQSAVSKLSASSAASGASSFAGTEGGSVAPSYLGKYTPGEAPSAASTARTISRRRRPQALGDVGEEWQGLRWTGSERRVEDTLPNGGEGVRAEVLEAQEKIRKDWHNQLAAETDWDKVPHAKASLGRPQLITRDRMRPSATSGSGRPSLSRQSASSSQAPSAASSPTNRSAPGPGLPGLPGPPFAGGPPMPGLPGPPLGGGPPIGGGLPIGAGPQMTAGPNPHARGAPKGRALPSWALK